MLPEGLELAEATALQVQVGEDQPPCQRKVEAGMHYC